MQKDVFDGNIHYAGTKATGKDEFVKPVTAVGKVYFGLFTVLLNALRPSSTELATTMLPYPQKITLSADMASTQTISGKLVVNGISTPFTKTYSGSHSATLAALKDDLELLEVETGVSVGVVTVSGQSFSIEPAYGHEIYFKEVVVTGTSAPGVAYAITKPVIGLAKRQMLERNSDGSVQYEKDDTVEAVQKGDYYAVAEDADINPLTDSVFVRIVPETGKQVGALKRSADNGKAVAVQGIKFTSLVENGIVAISLDI